MNSQEIGAVIKMINDGDMKTFDVFVKENQLPACGEIRIVELNRISWLQKYIKKHQLQQVTKIKLMKKGSSEMILAYLDATKGKKLPFNAEKELIERRDNNLLIACLQRTALSSKAVALVVENYDAATANAVIALNR